MGSVPETPYVNSFTWTISMESCAGFFSMTFIARLLQHAVSQGFHSGLSPGDILRELIDKDDFHGLFRGAFFVRSFAVVFCKHCIAAVSSVFFFAVNFSERSFALIFSVSFLEKHLVSFFTVVFLRPFWQEFLTCALL